MPYRFALMDSVWRFRGLVAAVTLKDLRSRYTGSLLGPLWLFVQPLIMVLIYTLVFSQVMKARLPGQNFEYAYSVYLCAGLFVWSFFVELVQRGKMVFLDHANLIKKASFPRLILFLPIVIVALLNFGLMLLLFLLFQLMTGGLAGMTLLPILPVVALMLVMGLGAALVLAVFNVFFRDVGQIVDVLLQVLFWSTPIVYPVSILPETVRTVLGWNPLFVLIEHSQHAFLGGETGVGRLVYPALCALAIALLAIVSYRRLYPDLVDEL